MLNHAPISPRSTKARFTLTRHRAAIIVVLAYAAAAVIAKLLLSYLGQLQNDPERAGQVTLVVAVIMLVLCAKALFDIYRSPKLPDA